MRSRVNYYRLAFGDESGTVRKIMHADKLN